MKKIHYLFAVLGFVVCYFCLRIGEQHAELNMSDALQRKMNIFCVSYDPKTLRAHDDPTADALMNFKKVGGDLWCSNSEAFRYQIELWVEKQRSELYRNRCSAAVNFKEGL